MVDHDVIQSIILYNTYSFVTILVAPIYQKNRQWSMPTKISVAKKSGGFISETNDCTGKKNYNYNHHPGSIVTLAK